MQVRPRATGRRCDEGGRAALKINEERRHVTEIEEERATEIEERDEGEKARQRRTKPRKKENREKRRKSSGGGGVRRRRGGERNVSLRERKGKREK